MLNQKKRGLLLERQVILLAILSCQCLAFTTTRTVQHLGHHNKAATTTVSMRKSPIKLSSQRVPEPTTTMHGKPDIIIDATPSGTEELMEEDMIIATKRTTSTALDEAENRSPRTGSEIVPWTALLAKSYSTENNLFVETESVGGSIDIMDKKRTHDDVAVGSVEPAQASTEMRKTWLKYDSLYTVLSSAMIGAMTGFAVAIFKLSVEALRELLYGTSLSEQVYWWSIPAIGGVAVGLLSMTGSFSPGLRGTANEVDASSLNTEKDERFTSPLRFLRKPLAAIITLGSGNSLGPEGPSVEIGMTISRLVMPPSIEAGPTSVGVDEGTATINRVRRNRLLLSAGAAAGVSAGFNAPLSGVFFALEIVQQSFAPLALPVRDDADTDNPTEKIAIKLQKVRQGYFSSGSGSITAILLASVLSALVAKVYLGEHLVLHIPKYNLNTPLLELPMYMLLGIISGAVAGSFTALAQFCKRVFDGEGGPSAVRTVMRNLPSWSKPAIGGLFCGSIALFYPQILFFGYETLNSLMGKNALPLSLILTLLGVKMLSTAVCAGSGLVGGTFAPALFLGGMTGAAFHRIAEQVIAIGASGGPFVLADVQAYALVGAAGVLSALFRAPLTASLILFELTRDYDVILPLMVTASIGSVVGDAVEKALEEKRRDRDAVSWGDLSDDNDADSDKPRQ